MTAAALFAVAPDALPLDRRAGSRQRTCFAVGKLTVAGRDRVCLVRNLSEQGAGIELDRPPAPGARVTIETRALSPAAATVVWARDRMAGLRLDAPIVPPDPELRPRSPRFDWARDVRLIVENRIVAAPVRDISLGGVGLGIHVPVGLETLVVVLAGPFSLPGRICWQAGGASGVRFTRPLAAAELAGMLDWNDAAGMAVVMMEADG